MDRGVDRGWGLGLDEFFSWIDLFLELDEVFQILQKLELDLAEKFSKNYLDSVVGRLTDSTVMSNVGCNSLVLT